MFETIDKILKGLQKAREVAQRIHDAELMSTVADLMMDSAQLKVEVAELRTANANLRGELEKIRAQQDVRAKLKFEEMVYYLTEPIPGYPIGPFCPRCADTDNRLVALLGPGFQRGIEFGPGVISTPSRGGWTCPECVLKRRK